MMLRSLALLGAFSCAAIVSAQTGPIAWRTDLATAQAEAQQTGKLVLLHFWTERCGPCRLLDKNVFSQPAVSSAVEANYIPVKVKAAAGSPLTETYKITRVPTDVVVTAQGELVEKFVSPATPMAYVGQTSQIAANYKTQLGQQYNTMVAGSPYTQPGVQHQLPQAGPQPGVITQQPQAAQATQQAPAQAQAERIAMTQAQPPVAAVSASTPATPATPAPSTAKPALPGVTNPYYQPTPEPQIETANETVTPAPTSPAAPEAVQIAATTPANPAQQNPVQQAPSDASLPAGSPPLGFEGYCPVTMKKEWRWAEGDVKWGAIHRGRTYLFGSQANRDEFLRDPDSFSPVLEGADPVMAVEKNASIPGTREYALEYEGRFYFFAEEETLNKFWTQPNLYAQGAIRLASQLDATKTR